MNLFRNENRRRRLKAYYRHYLAKERAQLMMGALPATEYAWIKPPIEEDKPSDTLSDRAWKLFARHDWIALQALKKKAKKGWKALGFSEYEVRTIESNLG